MIHMHHESCLVQCDGELGETGDSGLKKKANSGKYGYSLQISRRLSHRYVLQVITLPPTRVGTRRVRLWKGNRFCIIRRHFLKGRAAQEGSATLDTGMMAAGRRHKPLWV